MSNELSQELYDLLDDLKRATPRPTAADLLGLLDQLPQLTHHVCTYLMEPGAPDCSPRQLATVAILDESCRDRAWEMIDALAKVPVNAQAHRFEINHLVHMIEHDPARRDRAAEALLQVARHHTNLAPTTAFWYLYLHIEQHREEAFEVLIHRFPARMLQSPIEFDRHRAMQVLTDSGAWEKHQLLALPRDDPAATDAAKAWLRGTHEGTAALDLFAVAFHLPQIAQDVRAFLQTHDRKPDELFWQVLFDEEERASAWRELRTWYAYHGHENHSRHVYAWFGLIALRVPSIGVDALNIYKKGWRDCAQFRGLEFLRDLVQAYPAHVDDLVKLLDPRKTYHHREFCLWALEHVPEVADTMAQLLVNGHNVNTRTLTLIEQHAPEWTERARAVLQRRPKQHVLTELHYYALRQAE